MTRLGLLGGSFNPVHYGHLLLAEIARETCRLDQVWFVPAAVAPHKPLQSLAGGQDRIEMLQLAIGGQASFQVSRLELDRGGVSYTVDTLAELARVESSRELFLILGADSLADLPNWREPARICELATLIVAQRAGTPEVSLDSLAPFVSPERLAHFAQHKIEMPAIGLSSSDIRRRAREGRSIRFRTPRAVEEYICAHQLYRDGESGVTPGRPEEIKHSCEAPRRG